MKPIAIFYEHPDWFKPLFAELDRRQLPYVKIAADHHGFDLAASELPYSLVFNRASPSAYLRGRGHITFYTQDWLGQLEHQGIPVVNGTKAYGHEISKIRQLQLLQQLKIRYPKSWAINHPRAALEAARDLRFPIVVKANIGGSGAGIVRYDRMEDLETAVDAGTLPMGIDGSALVQEYAKPAGGHIVRIEVLNGEYLYAIKVYPPQGTFDLCPADACQTSDGRELVRAACAIDAPKRGLRVERADPPQDMIDAAVKIARTIDLDVGGIEYLVDERDGQAYIYDINALSNFVADAVNVIGFDPFAKLVDYLEYRARIGRPQP
jgi:glutathione synthase/RimK-type ligase-like ATP-grasp enzyme